MISTQHLFYWQQIKEQLQFSTMEVIPLLQGKEVSLKLTAKKAIYQLPKDKASRNQKKNIFNHIVESDTIEEI